MFLKEKSEPFPSGFSPAISRGFFPASSGLSKPAPFRVEGAGQNFAFSIPSFLSGIPLSGVTRSHSFPNWENLGCQTVPN